VGKMVVAHERRRDGAVREEGIGRRGIRVHGGLRWEHASRINIRGMIRARRERRRRIHAIIRLRGSGVSREWW